LYQIDEIAKLSGLTKRAIRYYEEIGLLAPPERTEGGYRVYGEAHLARLTEVVTIRDTLGLSLVQIQEFVAIQEQVDTSLQVIRGNPDSPERPDHLRALKALLDRQRTLIAHQIEKVRTIQADTDARYQRVLAALVPYSKE